MVSLVDVTVPVWGNPTTESVRSNFEIIWYEITELQKKIEDIVAVVSDVPTNPPGALWVRQTGRWTELYVDGGTF